MKIPIVKMEVMRRTAKRKTAQVKSFNANQADVSRCHGFVTEKRIVQIKRMNHRNVTHQMEIILVNRHTLDALVENAFLDDGNVITNLIVNQSILDIYIKSNVFVYYR